MKILIFFLKSGNKVNNRQTKEHKKKAANDWSEVHTWLN